MNCSPTELKDYIFGELNAADRARVDQHVCACAGCREELDRLRVTQVALAALHEEDPPRRIAFVSDPVFEKKPGWWHAWWNSAPRLGFASALVLAAAIFAHGVMARPERAAAPVQAVAAIDQGAFDARVAGEVARRLPAAVEKAVAGQSENTVKMVADLEQRMNFERRADLVAFQEEVNYLKKKLAVAKIEMASVDAGGRVQ